MSLLSAALAGEIDKIKELITQGANVNQADEDGVTPIHNAVKKVSVNYDVNPVRHSLQKWSLFMKESKGILYAGLP